VLETQKRKDTLQGLKTLAVQNVKKLTRFGGSLFGVVIAAIAYIAFFVGIIITGASRD